MVHLTPCSVTIDPVSEVNCNSWSDIFKQENQPVNTVSSENIHFPWRAKASKCGNIHGRIALAVPLGYRITNAFFVTFNPSLPYRHAEILSCPFPEYLGFQILSEQRLNSQNIYFHFLRSSLLNALVLTLAASDSLLTMLLLNPLVTSFSPSSTISIFAGKINSF